MITKEKRILLEAERKHWSMIAVNSNALAHEYTERYKYAMSNIEAIDEEMKR